VSLVFIGECCTWLAEGTMLVASRSSAFTSFKVFGELIACASFAFLRTCPYAEICG
jgi:hypothetical protein